MGCYCGAILLGSPMGCSCGAILWGGHVGQFFGAVVIRIVVPVVGPVLRGKVLLGGQSFGKFY